MFTVRYHYYINETQCDCLQLSNGLRVYDPSSGKTSEDFRFIFTDREAIGKNKQKIRSHLGPVPQVSEIIMNSHSHTRISRFLGGSRPRPLKFKSEI